MEGTKKYAALKLARLFVILWIWPQLPGIRTCTGLSLGWPRSHKIEVYNQRLNQYTCTHAADFDARHAAADLGRVQPDAAPAGDATDAGPVGPVHDRPVPAHRRRFGQVEHTGMGSLQIYILCGVTWMQVRGVLAGCAHSVLGVLLSFLSLQPQHVRRQLLSNACKTCTDRLSPSTVMWDASPLASPVCGRISDVHNTAVQKGAIYYMLVRVF